MRNLLTTLVFVALLAAPSVGIINVKLTADGPIVDGKVQLANGATTTIYIWAQADASLYSLAGDIKAGAADPVLLTANPASIVFDPAFNPDPATGMLHYFPRPGTAGSNGGWSSFGSIQTDYINLSWTVGVRPNWALFCYYTVTAAAMGMGDVTLTYAPKAVSGFKPTEINKGTTFGSSTSVTVSVVPEPLTLALLTLGTFLTIRRRH